MLLALAGPSGSGKTTVSAELCTRYGYRYFAPHTTRPMRPGERAEVGYQFVTSTDFRYLVDTDALLFHDVHYGHNYGLARDLIDVCSTEPKVLVTVPIWRMADLRILLPATFCVYLLPPDVAEVESRIANRSPITQAELAERVASKDQEWFTRIPGLHLVPPASTAEIADSILQATERDNGGRRA